MLPQDRAQAVAAVKAAAAHGVAIVPRGGGMSYTKGYLPDSSDSVVIDTRKLNGVLEVNVADRYVTVEAGCTWAQVHEALKATGMSTGYWGPLSGINATVGGALSQNSAFFGSTLHGTVAAHVLGVTVLLAQGDVVTTGSGGRVGTKPFTRYAGPDMTGPVPRRHRRLRPQACGHAQARAGGRSTWTTSASASRTCARWRWRQVEMSAVRAISEGFGIDRAKALNSASVNKLSEGVKILGSVARSSKGLLQGIKDAVGVATTGAGYLADHECSLHLVIEGSSEHELAASMAALRAIGKKHGIEIENAAAAGHALAALQSGARHARAPTASAGCRSTPCSR